jgi:hypothetical protein
VVIGDRALHWVICHFLVVAIIVVVAGVYVMRPEKHQ